MNPTLYDFDNNPVDPPKCSKGHEMIPIMGTEATTWVCQECQYEERGIRKTEFVYKPIEPHVWEKKIIDYMTRSGWTCDRNDEKTLGFSFIEGDAHWIRDYDKKTQSFVQFNGNQVVNFRVSKEENDE